MNKRDLKADLEICNRASKAPWRVATNKHPTTSGNSWGWVEGTRENWCWSNDNKKSYADARFIAQAREGWPHAIERAIKAEAEVEQLKGEIEQLLEIAFAHIPDVMRRYGYYIDANPEEDSEE